LEKFTEKFIQALQQQGLVQAGQPRPGKKIGNGKLLVVQIFILWFCTGKITAATQVIKHWAVATATLATPIWNLNPTQNWT
jgi:hypothetical protein